MAKGYYPFYRSMCTDDFYSRLDQTVSPVVDSDIRQSRTELIMNL